MGEMGSVELQQKIIQSPTLTDFHDQKHHIAIYLIIFILDNIWMFENLKGLNLLYVLALLLWVWLWLIALIV